MTLHYWFASDDTYEYDGILIQSLAYINFETRAQQQLPNEHSPEAHKNCTTNLIPYYHFKAIVNKILL